MLKLGIIGRNFVVDRLFAAAADVPDLQPVAIYSRSLDGAKSFAHTHNLTYAFDQLDDLAICPEVDAVYVASPNFCHFKQCKLMLEHGKHVLCEKPGVTNSKQLDELLSIAQANGVVYLEAMRLIHDDALDVVRAALPKIGALRRVTFEMTQYSSRYDRFRASEPDINAFNPALSNGSLMDLGCYCIHAIVALFGKPQHIHGVCSKLDNGFDSNGIVLMQYPNFVAEAVYSKVCQQIAPTTLMGDDGSILIENLDHINRIWFQPRKGTVEELPYTKKLPNNLMYELQHFCDMAAGKSDPAPWNELSRITQEIMDKARSDMGIRFPEEAE